MTSLRKRPPAAPWVLSAESETELIEQAAQLKNFVEQRPELDFRDVAYSLVASREVFHDHRAVAVGADRDELLSGLAAIASRSFARNVVSGETAAKGAIAFVFPGQGSPWTGAAVELLESAPAFSDRMSLCDAVFAEFVDWSLIEALRDGVGSASLGRVDLNQPVLFAVTVSLAAQWQALGIRPDAVLGHAQGEVAAAYVAGGLSLREAAKVIVALGAATSSIAGTGGMISIMRPVERVHALIQPWARSISVAAHNGPSSTVVTGPTTALDELVATCIRGDVPIERSPVEGALHSTHVESVRESLRESLSGLHPQTCDVEFISTVTGAGMDTSILDGEYWFANLRQPVLFEHAVRWAHEHGCRNFVESSQHPTLTDGIQDSLDALGGGGVVGTLRRNEDGLYRLLLSASALFVQGNTLNWASLLGAAGTNGIDLPTGFAE